MAKLTLKTIEAANEYNAKLMMLFDGRLRKLEERFKRDHETLLALKKEVSRPFVKESGKSKSRIFVDPATPRYTGKSGTRYEY